MFWRGMPGLVPPPTDKIIPRSPPFSNTSSVAARTSSGVPRTPTSSGFTFPIRHMRSPTRALTSAMSVCLPQFSTLKPQSGK